MTGRVLLVDGQSGAGKTTIAGDLAHRLGAHLIHVEHFYPGWDGLAAGAHWLVSGVLEPWSRGESVRLREWDWHRGGFRPGALLRPGGDLVVEGCGAITAGSLAFSTCSVWLEVDESTRHDRATARDGDDSWWAGWRAQELAFYARERSRTLADRILDATSTGAAEDEIERALAARGWSISSSTTAGSRTRPTGSRPPSA